MSKEFRVALVGCGAICGNHVKAISAANQSLCALCDVKLDRARSVAAKHDLSDARLYTSYTQMLDCEKPDAVHICTPHYLHAEMVTQALERGIHVLCEKPLCISMDELYALRNVAKKSTAQLGVCHQNRYEPNMLRLKELAKEGIRGGCGYVVWNRDEAYYRSADWRGTQKMEGGGVMINQALHTLDLLQWICGMPTQVIAHTHNDHLKGVIEVEDTATARFETADGKTLHFFATTASITDFPVRLEVRLASGATVLATNRLLVHNEVLENQSAPEAVVGKTVWGDGHKALIADFYAHLSKQIPFPIGIEEAEKVLRLIFAMYRSNGEITPIPN